MNQRRQLDADAPVLAWHLAAILGKMAGLLMEIAGTENHSMTAFLNALGPEVGPAFVERIRAFLEWEETQKKAAQSAKN